MILSGIATAVTLGGVDMSPLLEYTLQVSQERETYVSLDEPFEKGIATNKNWKGSLKMKAPLAARSYGIVECDHWQGAYMETWKASIEAKLGATLVQQDMWQYHTVDSFLWSLESEKWVDSGTKRQFLKALAESETGLVTAQCPMFSGSAHHGDAETKGSAGPQKESLAFGGNGLPTVGSFLAAHVGLFLTMRDELLSQRYANWLALSIEDVASGYVLPTKLDAESDGKTIDVTLAFNGTGEPTIL